MLAALRSGDPELIARYSDLTIPDMDKKLLELSMKIHTAQSSVDSGLGRYQGNEQAERLYNLLVGMDCESDLIAPLVERVFADYPQLSVRELMPIVLEWYKTKPDPIAYPPKNKTLKIKVLDWHTLDSVDLRFKFSQSDNNVSVYKNLKQSNIIFDVDAWLKMAS
jgi:hypothetical protein